MSYYTVIDRDGKHHGVKIMTDAMADRMEARGYHLIPTEAPAIKVTFGRKTR